MVFKFTTKPPKTTKGITMNGEACMAKFGYLQMIPATIPIKYPDKAVTVNTNSTLHHKLQYKSQLPKSFSSPTIK